MSNLSLSQRLAPNLKQTQKLTFAQVLKSTLLQYNRLDLQNRIRQEISENPFLEESTGSQDELTAEEVQAILESEREKDPHPADEAILEAIRETIGSDSTDKSGDKTEKSPETAPAEAPSLSETATDPFEDIDLGSFFQDYLDPGYKAPASEPIDKPSFETFLSAPVTLADYLEQQLSMLVLSEGVRDAADSIIGNIDSNGYLKASLEEIATSGDHPMEEVEQALEVVQSLDPAGVGARDLRECLLLQLKAHDEDGTLAWTIISDHIKLLASHKKKELAKAIGITVDELDAEIEHIQELDPHPGARFSARETETVAPEIFIVKEGDDYVIRFDEEGSPQLRVNLNYRYMKDRKSKESKEVREFVKQRYESAFLLIKCIDHRRQTILSVCESIVRRQRDFLERGIDELRPMMIKEVAEELGVDPSTVSRAVANKYADTPQGFFELRELFSEPVKGRAGAEIPLLVLKRKVKKMIEEEDCRHPLTDDHLAHQLQKEGFDVSRRTVAKYREDMKIPSTHYRRVRE